MKQKKIIGLVGEQAGGKGTVANIIIKRFGGTRLTTSDILRRTLDSLYLDSSRDNLITLAIKLKLGFGNDVLMKAMLREVEKEDTDLVIVDGIRMPGDANTFREAYGNNFRLLYVTASQKLRWERSRKRGEKIGENTCSFRAFCKKEKAKTERYVAEVGAEAEFRINNEVDYADLEKQVLDIMSNI